MGFSSQSGQVGFKTQATAGTFDPDFATDARFMKLRSGSLGPNRDLLVTDPEIGGGRDTTDAYLGAASWAGDYEFYVRLEAIGTLIQGVLGTPVVSTVDIPVAGANTHDFAFSDSATLPFLSVEEKIGSGLESYHYTDAVVNTFHLESDANGFFMGTAGLIAKLQTAGITPTDADTLWDNSPLIVGTNILITYNGVTLPAKSFSLDINNNFEDDDFRLGSFFLGDLTAKQREVNGSFTIRPQDSNLWRQAVYGVNSLTSVGGLTTKQQLVITAQTYENVTGTTHGKLTVTIPKAVLEPYALEPSGDDVIENDISWRAVRPDPGTGIGTLSIVNGAAAVA